MFFLLVFLNVGVVYEVFLPSFQDSFRDYVLSEHMRIAKEPVRLRTHSV